jgi:Peptidyl-prolyl cis-trans isomerase (rotamase) - cyclophilin family
MIDTLPASKRERFLSGLWVLIWCAFFLNGLFPIYAEDQPAGTPAATSTPSPTPTPVPKSVRVTLKTSMGDIELDLNGEKAPVTVQNFLQYVDSGFYNDTLFHRVIPKFIIQGGGFTKGMTAKKAGAPITNEAGNGLRNLRGTIGMARDQMINSATSQFYINVADNPFLDHRDNIAKDYGYCVFGKVTKGMDIVDKIAGVPTTTAGIYRNVPKQDIVITETKQTK